MTSHTPGKLRVVTERTRPNQGFSIRGEGAALIAETVEDHETVNGQANAERLVHCWNCHDELVEALKAAHRKLDLIADGNVQQGNLESCADMAMEIRALIANAERKEVK
jgi:hypothetical protein